MQRGSAEVVEFYRTAPSGWVHFWDAKEDVRTVYFGDRAIPLGRVVSARIATLERLAAQRKRDLSRWGSAGALSRGGILSALSRPPVLTLGDDRSELSSRKLARVEQRLTSIRDDALLFAHQHDFARDLLRQHCAAEPVFLKSCVIDRVGTIRVASPRAWRHEDNWRSYSESYVLESGTEPLEPKGTPYILRADLDRLLLCIALERPSQDRQLSKSATLLSPILSGKSGKRPSATQWFDNGGRQECEAYLHEQGKRITQKSVCDRATIVWNDQHPKHQVTPAAFKKGHQRRRADRKGTKR